MQTMKIRDLQSSKFSQHVSDRITRRGESPKHSMAKSWPSSILSLLICTMPAMGLQSNAQRSTVIPPPTPRPGQASHTLRYEFVCMSAESSAMYADK